MLKLFRTHYPQGSLTSELVTIDRGKYLVRTLVQVEGITLATGFAAADTVEQAEDRSRERALSALNLASTPQTTSRVTKSVEASAPHPLELEPANGETKGNSDLGQEPTGDSSLSRFEQAQDAELSSAGNGSNREPNVQTEPSLFDSSDSFLEPPQNQGWSAMPETSPKEAVQTTEDWSASASSQPASYGDASRTQPEALPLEQEDSANIHQDADLSAQEREPAQSQLPAPPLDYSFSQDEELPSSDAHSSMPPQSQAAIPTPTASIAAPIDFSDVIAKTNVEMKRLGWTSEQGRKYLLENYGKRSRQLLSDDELLEFLNHLESIPSPS